jgi:hypothetical protein
MPVTVERRDLKAAAIGLALLIVGLVAAVAAALWFHHLHRSDVDALRHNRSYIYGERTLDRLEDASGMPTSIRAACELEFARQPPTFANYQHSLALQGCLAENDVINN